MKAISAALLFALAACQTIPAPGPLQPVPGEYRAVGTEPFWDLSIGRDLLFTDRGNNVVVAEPAPPVRIGVAGEIYDGVRLHVNIVHAACSDGMSDRTYPDTVNVTADRRHYRGCGASAAFFARPPR